MDSSDSSTGAHTVDIHRLVGTPRHRIFVLFDDPAAGREAVAEVIARGLAAEDDIWEFSGEDGSHRLDAAGTGHGLHGRLVRFIQWLMTDDYEYLQSLDRAITRGGLVLAVRAEGDTEVVRTAGIMRDHGGHGMKYCRHWDYTPLPL
jgi:hypothetical protein